MVSPSSDHEQCYIVIEFDTLGVLLRRSSERIEASWAVGRQQEGCQNLLYLMVRSRLARQSESQIRRSMCLDPSESDLQGTWVLAEGRLVEDEVTRRIHQLVRDHLKKVATDQSGWNVLYQDPVDGRYWELTYSTGETQAGGPPRLSALTHEQAERKYKIS